jgi:hypothetical protein
MNSARRRLEFITNKFRIRDPSAILARRMRKALSPMRT